eukprot:COSAG01_NODE_1568_length_9874_cov_15.549872_6_plen_242_part_00
MGRVAGLLLALAAAASTVSCAPPLRPWVNTSVGIHRFLAFDSALTAEQVNATAEEYDYVWGASAEYVQLWKAHSPDLIVSVYIPMTRDFRVCRTEPEPEESTPFHWSRNLSWWQAHHPDWIVYKADRKTPAYQYDDPCCVPLDISNALVRQFQLNNCTSAAVAAGLRRRRDRQLRLYQRLRRRWRVEGRQLGPAVLRQPLRRQVRGGHRHLDQSRQGRTPCKGPSHDPELVDIRESRPTGY